MGEPLGITYTSVLTLRVWSCWGGARASTKMPLTMRSGLTPSG